MPRGKFRFCFLELSGIFFRIFSIHSWLNMRIQNPAEGRLCYAVIGYRAQVSIGESLFDFLYWEDFASEASFDLKFIYVSNFEI